MNAAATPDVSFVVVQCISSRTGLRKIPPPTPVRPESKPITAPRHSAIQIGTTVASSFSAATLALRNNRTALYRSTMPTIDLYIESGKVRLPPMNDAGIEAAAKGQKVRQEKKPARKKRMVTKRETMILRVKEVGFM